MATLVSAAMPEAGPEAHAFIDATMERLRKKAVKAGMDVTSARGAVGYNAATNVVYFVVSGDGRRVGAAVHGEKLFGRRPQEQSILDGLERHGRVVVVGPRRAGKTTLIKRALRGRYSAAWHGQVGALNNKNSFRREGAEAVDVYDPSEFCKAKRATPARAGKAIRKAVYVYDYQPPAEVLEGAAVVTVGM